MSAEQPSRTKAAVDRYSGGDVVDPRDEPSAEWGWHGEWPRGRRIAGWAVAAIMFLLLIGNHEGHVETIWLVGIGLGMIGFLIWDQTRRRTPWRN